MTKRKRIESIKTVLIILLACSAIVLAVWTAALHYNLTWKSLRTLFQTETAGGETVSRQTETAAIPEMISVRNPLGRSSAMYDAAERDRLYALFGGTLAQSLEAAESAEPTDMETVLDALEKESVYFSYACAIPLHVLSGWMDADYSGSLEGTWFLLSLCHGKIELYFGTGETAQFCETDIPSEALLQELELFRPDGTAFACELDGCGRLFPLTLLDVSSAYPVYEASSQAVFDETFVAEGATELEFNPYNERYTGSDGTVSFREAGRTLQFSPDGVMTLTLTGQTDREGTAATETTAEKIEMVRSLISVLISGRIGDAEIALSSLEQTEGKTVIYMDYSLNGIPVRLTGAHAVEAVFTGDTLSFLQLVFRSYTIGTEARTLLPALQAAALAGDGECLQISYADSFAGTLQIGWESAARKED